MYCLLTWSPPTNKLPASNNVIYFHGSVYGPFAIGSMAKDENNEQERGKEKEALLCIVLLAHEKSPIRHLSVAGGPPKYRARQRDRFYVVSRTYADG